MGTLWAKEIGEALQIVVGVLRNLDRTLECATDTSLLFSEDVLRIMIRKEQRKAFVVITFEAWTNARTDPADMRQAFRRIIEQLSPEPTDAYLVTTKGFQQTSLTSGERLALDYSREWQRLEDLATSIEADQVARQLSGAQ
jgi:hypothetical protein